MQATQTSRSCGPMANAGCLRRRRGWRVCRVRRVMGGVMVCKGYRCAPSGVTMLPLQALFQPASPPALVSPLVWGGYIERTPLSAPNPPLPAAMTTITDHALSFVPLLLTALGVVALLGGVHWWLLARHPDLGNGAKLPRQLTLLGLTIVSAVALALALPVSDSTRNQVIGLIGVLISGVLAFSSTHILSNLMAGLMLRMTRAFRTGDFIRVEGHFGRVAERGLFDTEIQTEQRELVSLANNYLIAHPVAVVRSSGAIVSSTLTLGYDVHHARVQPLLLEAATAIGLEDPFVHILELGNFSIAYRVSGLLTDVKTLLTARSHLNCAILDTLHREGIEIMSPSFMNQRRVPDEAIIIPPAPTTPVATASRTEVAAAEEVVFDKAEEAEQRNLQRKTLKEQLTQLQAQHDEAEGDAKDALAQDMDALRAQIQDMENTTDDTDVGDDDRAVTATPAAQPPVPPPT